MTGHPSLSPRAEADLDDIWNFTVQRWGLDQAEAYTRQIWRAVEILAVTPALGQPCPYVRRGYYKYRAGSHLLFYRVVDGALDVVRILHESMDFDRHL
jgi:toxin ParE1/3/4